MKKIFVTVAEFLENTININAPINRSAFIMKSNSEFEQYGTVKKINGNIVSVDHPLFEDSEFEIGGCFLQIDCTPHYI